LYCTYNCTSWIHKSKEIKEFEVGEELKAVLKALGQQIGLESLPLALHMGSCVDNSRIGVFILTG